MNVATTSPSPKTLATVSLMGLRLAALSERETIECVLGALSEGHGGWLCTANLDILRQWRDSADVRALVSKADLVVADGMPLIWAGGLQGSPFPQRVAGSTLLLTLTAAAAQAGASIFLLGGNPGTADGAGRVLAERNPGLRVTGTMCPPFGFERDPEWQARLARALREAAPDIVYVGLGFPKQERLIVSVRSILPQTWFISCGVSFSFLAGEFPRAPAVLQRLGLEWLHRMAHEPKRLYHRYLVKGMPFFFQLLWSALAARWADAKWLTH